MFRQSQADELVAIRRGMDRGTHTAADLLRALKQSTGQEADAAIQQCDDDDEC